MNKIRVIDLLNKIANGEEVPETIIIYGDKYFYNREHCSIEGLYTHIGGAYWLGCADISLKTIIEIIEEEPEIDIQGIEQLNAYKLMEAPFMADKLKEMNYDTFMEHLKQSEIEIANKIIELTRAVKQLDNQINNK